ncbi:MAG: RedB protein [Planctomycetota bacterium]
MESTVPSDARPVGSWRRTGLWVVALGVWVGLVGGGFVAMNLYATTPGESGVVVMAWPEGTAVPRTAGRVNAVVFAHPDCPCTQATLANLGRLKAEYPEGLDLAVVFFDTASWRDAWAETRLKSMAERIPGAALALDPEGVEAGRFGVRTSGHVVVFDRQGARVFSGGVTASRGHEGASPGLDAIEQLLIGAADSGHAEAEVFGCALCHSTAVSTEP